MEDIIVSKYEWPYPIRYDVENMVSTDILILGGRHRGVLGDHLRGEKRGAKVVMVEKSTTIKRWEYGV